MTIRKVPALVSTNWLKSRLSVGGVQILDGSWNGSKDNSGYEDVYKKGHIKGAVHFDHTKCVNGTPNIPWSLPDTNCFTEYVQKLGVTQDSHLVIYDSQNTRPAARAWWLFRAYGHKSVSVLDGGMLKWQQDGFDVVSGDHPDVKTSDYVAQVDKNLVWNFERMKENLNTQEFQVMDARGNAEFDGSGESGTRPGHIPGAKNIPFRSVFTEQGDFKSKDDLMKLFEKAGIDLGRPLVSMCLTGLTACSLAAAAASVGKTDVPVYYGSWKEWSAVASDDMITKG